MAYCIIWLKNNTTQLRIYDILNIILFSLLKHQLLSHSHSFVENSKNNNDNNNYIQSVGSVM